MIYFALGCAALAFFVWIGRGRPFDLGRGWRIGAGALAVAAFAAAAFVAMRGLWGTGIVLAAYVRLMQRAHPDAGGSKGLAAQRNAARDVLLKKR